MTTSEYIQKQRMHLSELRSGIAVQIAAQDTHVKMSQRIFIDGKNASGGDIGTYDKTKELYVNPSIAPKSFATKGKDGKDIFQNKKKHKTAYFKSYSEYRAKVGRSSDKVNLILFGDLQSDFSKSVENTGENKYSSKIRGNNSNKVDGAKDKYGLVFFLSPEEKQNFKEVLEFETIKILNG